MPKTLDFATTKGSTMSLQQDILKLLSEEGYRPNEAIRDALEDFVSIVEEEAEDMAEDLEEDFDDED